MEKEYEEGSKSYLTSRGDYQNPYPIGSSEHNRFEAGWKQAAGQYPNVLRERQRRMNMEQRLEQRRANDQKMEETRLTAEAYRKAKGRE